MEIKEAIKRLRQETVPNTYNPDFDKEECLKVIEDEINQKDLIERALQEGVWYEDDGVMLFSNDVKFYYGEKMHCYRLIIKGYAYVNVDDYKETWCLIGDLKCLE